MNDQNKTPAEPSAPALSVVAGSEILWEDDGPDRIRGYITAPKTTLFIIERNPEKPYRGRMTGAVIPDEDEHPDGLLGNALISWLQGCAARMYLREFEDRIIARRNARETTPAAITSALADKCQSLGITFEEGVRRLAGDSPNNEVSRAHSNTKKDGA